MKRLRTGGDATQVNRSKTHVTTTPTSPIIPLYHWIHIEKQLFHHDVPPIIWHYSPDNSPVYLEDQQRAAVCLHCWRRASKRVHAANIYDSNRLAHQYDVHVVHVIKQLLGQRINRLMISACDLAIARKNRCIHLLDVGRHASYM